MCIFNNVSFKNKTIILLCFNINIYNFWIYVIKINQKLNFLLTTFLDTTISICLILTFWICYWQNPFCKCQSVSNFKNIILLHHSVLKIYYFWLLSFSNCTPIVCRPEIYYNSICYVIVWLATLSKVHTFMWARDLYQLKNLYCLIKQVRIFFLFLTIWTDSLIGAFTAMTVIYTRDV